MAASVRNVTVDNVSGWWKRSESRTDLTWTKSLGRHPISEDTHLKRTRATNLMVGRKCLTISERFEWVARWLGLKEPEAEVLFNPGGLPYRPSDITREHLLAVLEAICEG